jgi:hypothetical protein
MAEAPLIPTNLSECCGHHVREIVFVEVLRLSASCNQTTLHRLFLHFLGLFLFAKRVSDAHGAQS